MIFQDLTIVVLTMLCWAVLGWYYTVGYEEVIDYGFVEVCVNYILIKNNILVLWTLQFTKFIAGNGDYS